MKQNKRIYSMLLAGVMFLSCCFFEGGVSLAHDPQKNAQKIVLTAKELTEITETTLHTGYEGYEGTVILSEDNSMVSWSFEAIAGDYQIEVKYFPVSGDSSAFIARTLQVNDGEETAFQLVRSWVDDFDESGKFQEDIYGNQVRPMQVQKPQWLTTVLYDNSGESNEPIRIQLQDGLNTLKIKGENDALAIANVTLTPYEELASYENIEAEYAKKGYQTIKGYSEKYEAEYSLYKSDVTIYPNYERSSTKVTPQSAGTQCVNIIGGSGWNSVGQYIVWEIEVPESGLYHVNLNYRKDVNKGISSYRRLYIDGQVPFAEANSIEFPYTADFKEYLLGEEKHPYQFYLEKGTHELKLEVNLGNMASIVTDLESIIYNLNSIYRRIIVVTGTNPDFYRDYEFETTIPDVIKDIGSEIETIEALYQRWYELVGEKGSTFSTLDLLLKTLKSMHTEPDSIASELSALKTYIGSCGTLLTNVRDSQLELDSIEVCSSNTTKQSSVVAFFRQLWFSIKSVAYSFVRDYNAIGTMEQDKELEEITVWVTEGREQYEILKNLTNNGELEKMGIRINLQLVGVSLLNAIVADIAPDVMLTCGSSDVINYALRGALVDVSQFEDFEEVKKNYYEETFVPLTLEGKTYAIPTTMAYNVLFYREDVLQDLAIEVPKTWDDVTKTITLLNKSNLEFGFPSSYETYFALLTQKGGSMYNDAGSQIEFDTQVGIDTFTKYTRYFTDYGQPISYDAQNRFRTGEMPILIADYSFFNTLSVAAPEITGLWDFTLMPGTEQEDGSICSTSCLTTAGTVILKSSEKQEASWEFVKWWTSATIQTEYGRMLESVLGASSRYASANLETMNSMAWSESQKAVLFEQLYQTKAMPEVPGGYLTTRELNYAFRKVINEGADPKDTLLEYAKTINMELTAKRKEFGLETAE